jgi:hypothetical protein
VPIWLDQPPLIAQISLARFVSPDEDAAFEFAVGTIQGSPLTTEQAALIACQGLLGENPRLRTICAYDDPANPLVPSWARADYYRQSIMTCSGTAQPQPSMYMPATIVTYTNLFGPKDEFENLTRTVFIPLIGQMLGGGASSGDDDDDDDDD